MLLVTLLRQVLQEKEKKQEYKAATIYKQQNNFRRKLATI